MDISELMSIDTKSLSYKQHEGLKKHVLSVLKEVQNTIENEEYENIESFTFYSPAGDGHGQDSEVINFSWDKSNEQDISEVVRTLMYLKNKNEGELF